MTTTVKQAIEKIEAVFTTVEGVVKKEFTVIDHAVGTFLTSISPELLSDLTTLAKDLEQDLITEPDTAFTTILGQAENLGKAEWAALKPAVQTAVLTAITSMIQVGASLL